MSSKPRILTTTVGSYPVPNWLAALPSEQALIDATRVVVDIQRQAGIDLPTDGELYRFDTNHPDTNGMIEYFIKPLGGVRSDISKTDWAEFSNKSEMGFRRKPAGVVDKEISEGSLNLQVDCDRLVSAVGDQVKFTLTSPYMLARTLLDKHYGNFEDMLMAIAEVLAEQVSDLSCTCIQVDEANITGNPDDGEIAAKAINRILDSIKSQKAVHFCFGNYGGQTIQGGSWNKLINFLNSLRCDHLVLELQHRPDDDLNALKEIDSNIKLGIGVIDVKVNHIETPDEIAASIQKAEKAIGEGRIGWIHPDCGFWMLKRSVADRKMENMVKGRDKYLGI